MTRTDTRCTRCEQRVSDNDPDVRYKHGEVIACSACDIHPDKHRYHYNCTCQACENIKKLKRKEAI